MVDSHFVFCLNRSIYVAHQNAEEENHLVGRRLLGYHGRLHGPIVPGLSAANITAEEAAAMEKNDAKSISRPCSCHPN